MKFILISGQQIGVNLTNASMTGRLAKSKYQTNVYNVLQEEFANLDIYPEFHVNGLFFDFFIPSIRLMIEVDGEQHDSFNKFFHKNGSKFVAAIKRDENKKEFCDINRITLVRLNINEAMQKEKILEKIKNELEC